MYSKYNVQTINDDIQSIIDKQVKKIGKRLWNKAIELYKSNTYYSKSDITTILKAVKGRKKINGSTAIKTAVDEVFLTIENLETLKSRNRKYSIDTDLPAPLVERLNEFKIDDIYKNISDCINHPRNGEVSIRLTNNVLGIGFTDSHELDWDGYAKSCKYPMKIWDIRVTVLHNWRIKVLKKGLATVGGMITLDANHLSSIYEGVESFSATWLEKGRAYSQIKKHGYIARIGDVTYHGSTQKKAENGVINKVKRQSMPIDKIEALSQKRRFSRAKNLAKKYPNFQVFFSDSIDIGNCEDGTRSWCNNVGIDSISTYTTLSKFVDGYLKSPLPEAWNVFLYIEKFIKKSGISNKTIDKSRVA